MAVYVYGGKVVKRGSAYLSSGGSTLVTTSFTASRTSGPTPVNVLFDGTATSSTITQVNQSANGTAFRQLEYSWDFDDSTSGTWPISGLPRGTQVGGPIAAHVFDSGTKTHNVTLTVKVGLPWGTATTQVPRTYLVDDFVRQGGNTYRCLVGHDPGVFATDLGAGKWVLYQTGEISNSTSMSITATDAGSYAWTNKVYVSPSANYTNAPGGYTTQTTLPSLSTNNTRVLLRGNESYGNIALNGTYCQVAWDGFGGIAPNVVTMTMGGTNSSIIGMNATKGAQLLAGQTDCMYYNNTVTHSDVGAIVMYFDPAVNDPYTNMVRPWYVGNNCPDTTQPTYGAYGAGLQPVFMGNTAGWNSPFGADQEHSCRIFEGWQGFIAHNWWKGGSTDGIRLSLKIHALGFCEWTALSNVFS